MSVQTVEQIEMFSESELEILQFMPEELEQIESEQYPNLESISLEEVARDLEAYFVEDVEEVELEKFRLGKLGKLFKKTFSNSGLPFISGIPYQSKRKKVINHIKYWIEKIKTRSNRKRYRKRLYSLLSTGASLAVLAGFANQLRKDVKSGQ